MVGYAFHFMYDCFDNACTFLFKYNHQNDLWWRQFDILLQTNKLKESYVTFRHNFEIEEVIVVIY